jgi:hypothetical protein
MNERVAEWILRVGFALLALVALFAVFGDDLFALLQKR